MSAAKLNSDRSECDLSVLQEKTCIHVAISLYVCRNSKCLTLRSFKVIPFSPYRKNIYDVSIPNIKIWNTCREVFAVHSDITPNTQDEE